MPECPDQALQEGRNFTFDYIQTPDVEGYDRNYRELGARNIDVFLAVGNEPALRAALSAVEGRPIAFLYRWYAGNADAARKYAAALHCWRWRTINQIQSPTKN